MTKSPKVHNHGPTTGRGLGCPEVRINGSLVGHCLLKAALPEQKYKAKHARPVNTLT